MPRRADPAFGRVLKELREQRGFSLRRLGRIVHCSHGYLWDLEARTERPSPSVVALLDDALGANGRLASMARDPSGLESVPITSGLDLAPTWRPGVYAAVDLWRSDVEQRDLGIAHGRRRR